MNPGPRNSTEVHRLARRLRREMTPAERLLWSHLRARQLAGLKFRRQHPLADRFIADFYCPARRLVIEIDGDIHAGREEHDQARTQEVERRSYRVVRFQNSQVLNNLEGVLAAIHTACIKPPPQADST